MESSWETHLLSIKYTKLSLSNTVTIDYVLINWYGFIHLNVISLLSLSQCACWVFLFELLRKYENCSQLWSQEGLQPENIKWRHLSSMLIPIKLNSGQLSLCCLRSLCPYTPLIWVLIKWVTNNGFVLYCLWRCEHISNTWRVT